MELKYTATIMVLLAGLVVLTGCTGSPQPPVATPAPVPAVTAPGSPAPAMTAAPVTTPYTWTPETPAPGHPATKTYSFQGTGDYDELTFTTTSDATWEYSLTYPGDGVFTVFLVNGQGETVAVLADEAGSGTGRKTVPLKAGNYYFTVEADAPWYIMMSMV